MQCAGVNRRVDPVRGARTPQGGGPVTWRLAWPGEDGDDGRGSAACADRTGGAGWREAAEEALYGPGGFYRRPGGPGGPFPDLRARLPALRRAPWPGCCAGSTRRWGARAELAFVDMAAGRGELVTGVLAALPADVASRARAYAVELAGRPADLDHRIEWLAEPPAGDHRAAVRQRVAGQRAGGRRRGGRRGRTPGWCSYAADGRRAARGAGRRGGGASGWTRWWPLPPEEGLRAEIGLPRDQRLGRRPSARVDARAGGRRRLRAHSPDARPPFGTLTGFREGRETAPVPDGRATSPRTSRWTRARCRGPGC